MYRHFCKQPIQRSGGRCNYRQLKRFKQDRMIVHFDVRTSSEPCCTSERSFHPPPCATGTYRTLARSHLVCRLSQARYPLVTSCCCRADHLSYIWCREPSMCPGYYYLHFRVFVMNCNTKNLVLFKKKLFQIFTRERNKSPCKSTKKERKKSRSKF